MYFKMRYKKGKNPYKNFNQQTNKFYIIKMLQKIFILSLISVQLQLVLASPGVPVRCGMSNDSKSCGTSGGSSWVSSDGGLFYIADCSNIGTLSQAFDTICASCFSGSLQFVNSNQDGCQSTPSMVGDNAPCQKDGVCSYITCGSPQAFNWLKSNGDTKNCYIQSLQALPNIPVGFSILNDYMCQSADGATYFANSYGSYCVETSASCSRNKNWNDKDCNICNANGANSANIYASSDQTQCTNTVSAGVNVPCQTGGSCSNCNSPTGFAFSKSTISGDSSNCFVTSCSATVFPTTGLNDYFCSSCSKSNKFANLAGTACLNIQQSCTRTSNWFDSDCEKCNAGTANAAKKYASADQKSCIDSLPSIPGNLVPCQTGGSCNSCSAPTGFTFTKSTASSDNTNCFITSCLATSIPITNLSDNYCGSCNKANQFANSYGTACVNSKSSCSKKQGWTDEDCQICNANGSSSTNLYASQNKTQCVSIKPTSSASQLMVFIGLIVFSILF
ncbi:cell surface immobilization antigen (macronuclear) [Tetrahymena thermophila SB210]|uniref:Cell surface immobilization antigen n=1 Tax=Tetrahymena thermophila (strain SB210) TaxID=312017 RepID=Q23RQ3_TETTS|nr:cell surface immobilization antigen [Tetrahymena thermophila SB210]EAR99184.2 cell surface immobilization antigen [Tetrahymena thermophila SB210]|eukprot:XP_001019429.2 cell surface immobilization antigen [Tetrahymena thermophila SB210]